GRIRSASGTFLRSGPPRSWANNPGCLAPSFTVRDIDIAEKTQFALPMTERQTAGSDIPGVEIKRLASHPDARGFFGEVIRATDPCFAAGSENFAQWSHSKMARNTIKAWHFHHRQTDWWYCAIGVLQTVLIDLREESPAKGKKLELFMGDHE